MSHTLAPPPMTAAAVRGNDHAPSIPESTTLRALSTCSPGAKRISKDPPTSAGTPPSRVLPANATTPAPQLESAPQGDRDRNSSGLTLADVRKLDHDQLASLSWVLLGMDNLEEIRNIRLWVRDTLEENSLMEELSDGAIVQEPGQDMEPEKEEAEGEQDNDDGHDDEPDEGEEMDARWTRGKITDWVSVPLFSVLLQRNPDKNYAPTSAKQNGEGQEAISVEKTGKER
ncbi:hypothetical protein MPH_06484 [Macrophomina phaseolina MS6]|uniref:Uncharacterized protein n=1 Tax=Macrophomina phaseolina (strain MS6) TaxID=1126212 RepID=K2S1C3_MACPH|nr:hypothetical protein MPH_06484 [Macrophomina phaseolina MS6]